MVHRSSFIALATVSFTSLSFFLSLRSPGLSCSSDSRITSSETNLIGLYAGRSFSESAPFSRDSRMRFRDSHILAASALKVKQAVPVVLSQFFGFRIDIYLILWCGNTRVFVERASYVEFVA